MKNIRQGLKNDDFRQAIICLLLFLLALGLRTRLRNQFEFDGLYGQDAFAYYEYGQEVKNAAHELRAPGPMYWPLGFPIVLATGFAIFGENEHVAQSTVLVMGALIPVLAYAFVIDIVPSIGWSKKAGQVAGSTAAFILMFSGQMLQSSVVVMADVPSLFWAALSLWALGRYLQKFRTRQGHWWIALAAFGLAMATITRWLYGVLAIPYALSCLMLWQGWKKERRKGQVLALPLRNAPKYWRDGLIAVLGGGLILLPQFLHSRSNPASVVDHAWLRDWDIENAFKKDFVTPDGTFEYTEDIAHYYARAAYDGWYMHPIFTVALGIGLLVLLRKTWRNQAAISLFILLVGWTIAAYGFLAGVPYQNVRFSLAFFLPLAIMVGIGVAGTWEIIAKLSDAPLLKPISMAARGFILLAVLVGVQSEVPKAHDTVAWIVERKNEDYRAVQQAKSEIPAGGTVYVLELWPMMRHYVPEVQTVQIYYETPESMVIRLPDDMPAYVLLNMWAIENQWVGKIPYQIYHALAENLGLEQLGRYGNYVLYRVLE